MKLSTYTILLALFTCSANALADNRMANDELNFAFTNNTINNNSYLSTQEMEETKGKGWFSFISNAYGCYSFDLLSCVATLETLTAETAPKDTSVVLLVAKKQ